MAEGGGLLNRYRINSPIVGSNPIPSAIVALVRAVTPLFALAPAAPRALRAVKACGLASRVRLPPIRSAADLEQGTLQGGCESGRSLMNSQWSGDGGLPPLSCKISHDEDQGHQMHSGNDEVADHHGIDQAADRDRRGQLVDHLHEQQGGDQHGVPLDQ